MNIYLSAECGCKEFLVGIIDGYIVMPANFLLMHNRKQQECIIDVLEELTRNANATLVIARIKTIADVFDLINLNKYMIKKHNGLYYAFFPEDHEYDIKRYMRDLDETY